ncbi:MAG: NADH-quinone oxidoreductase subunit J, partial [Thermodesulfobacteriaceae bacterium]|nr:NADH-quinone oxidoreductase subunit J [Thermodesulfobacteriaceae bacterium]
MNWDIIIFFYLGLAMLISSLLAVVSRNPVHAILWILVMIIHQAFLLYTLGSEFLTAIQIIVYAGAVLVLFLFVVYMINLRKEERWRVFVEKTSLGCLLFLIFLYFFCKNLAFFSALIPTFKANLPYDLTQGSNLLWMARYLYSNFLFQFEVIGVILL